MLLLTATPIFALNGLTESYGGMPHEPEQTGRLIETLQTEGVQVGVTDKLTIIIPVDNLFRFPSSTRLIDRSRSQALYDTADLVRSYGNRLITVSGHTDNVGSDAAKLKRSKDQAETVAAFLWSRGVPLKNIIVIGCGDTAPVSSNLTLEGSAANRRIEIEVG